MMKRTGCILLVIFLALGLGLPASALQVQPEGSQSQEQAQGDDKQQGILDIEEGRQISVDINAYRSSNMLGSAIYNKQGQELGNIENLIINIDNGEISFAVMSCCGLLGFGDKLFAIPWDNLEPQPDVGIFVLDVTRQQMEEIEGLSEGNWPGIGNRQWATGPPPQGPYTEGYSQGETQQYQQQQEQQVSIEGNTFNPAEIEVQPGTTITWNNMDNVPHTVTSGSSGDDDAGELFDSGTMETQQEYSMTFDQPGEYPYYCRFHPEMEGMVMVSE